MNIIWKKPDGTVAVSYVTAEVNWLAEEAERLQQAGAVPADWVAVAIDYPLPAAFAEKTWQWDDLREALALDLSDARNRKLQNIKDWAAKTLAAISASYPDGEVQSWAQQAREAEALALDPNSDAPLLTAIATARGLAVTELAARVRAKVAAYAVASGQIIGLRQALEDALMAIDLQAPDAAEQLQEIQWPELA